MVRGENFLKAVGKTIRKTVKFFSCNIRPKDEEDEDVPRRLRRRKKTQSTHFEEEVVEDIAALSADVHPPLFKELTTDIDPSLLEELTADVHPPLFEELTADIDPSLLEELTADVHPPLFEELTADIDPSLLEELTADVYPPLLDKLTMNVHQSPSRELTAEVQQFPLQGLTAGVHPSLSQIVVIAQVHRAFSDSPVPEEAKDEEEEDNEGCRSVVQKEQLAKDIAEEKPAILWDLNNDIWRVEDECRPHSASCRHIFKNYGVFNDILAAERKSSSTKTHCFSVPLPTQPHIGQEEIGEELKIIWLCSDSKMHDDADNILWDI
ncbi:fibrous sheath CABYR-binding protein-like [Sceloporus undulatus]|uniref:fibrous sheath CABYR-binding protein-like n=1 Tax=Sceloporus undulatus TaxID=8520 RepID=UPI001C4B4935|nr:fibrous sheath CABYR-binding protein-like [Sceloporus undulatus]